MKLFKCHAIMPSVVGRGSYLVRTYVVIASTWQEARARVWNQEPRAEFVTMPGEVADALIINDEVMSEREFADLRAACKWSESQLRQRAD